MSEKVQMTEEQFEDIFNFFFNINFQESYKSIKHFAKIKGYILPDPVEESEKLYDEFKKAFQSGNGPVPFSRDELIYKQHEAIQFMKPYYEKHKGENI